VRRPRTETATAPRGFDGGVYSTLRSRPTISRTMASWLMSVPSSVPTSRPSRRTTTRSQASTTSCRRCEMKMTAMPSALRPAITSSSLSVSAQRQAGGRLVEDDEARAEAQRLGDLHDLLLRQRQPRHRRRGREGRAEPLRGRASRRARAGPSSTSRRKPYGAARARYRRWPRHSRLSKRLSSWWTKAMPAAIDCSTVKAAWRRRRSRSSRWSGATTPPRIFIRVDLPAPFSPTRPITSPAGRPCSKPASATTPG
jgi:hypothetical protein